MQLLCDPARPRRDPGAARRRPCSTRCGGVSHRATGRSCSPGSISAAIETARPAMPCRASCARSAPSPGLERLRLSSIEINHVDAELVSALAGNAERQPASARPAPIGRRRRAPRHGSPLYLRHVPPPTRAARRLQPHDRCDRRLSDRRRARFPQHALGCRGSRNHKSPCLPVLAATGNGHCRRRRRRSCGQEGPGCPVARGLASGVSRALA